MKLYIFKKEIDKLDDLEKDPVIKKKFKCIFSWSEYIMLGTDNPDSETESYLFLKYGEQLITRSLIRDFSPIPYVDYQPDPARPEKYKNVYK